ncbi:GMC family oxidoreductase N-terminal domain-containing protein [Gammaproteobacteria bacterium]|nr:GMC family oxidoreductase N-terminal domain-containing protein [Gammaproteobacteria bacterium]
MSKPVNESVVDLGDFDYIIVGAGSAGCVLANRLSANPAMNVLLLEAGGMDSYPWIHIPIGYLFCMGNPRTDWMMRTAADEGLNGRQLDYPRGKVIGGCSAINGMIYMRGQSGDYDHWQALGNRGWNWSSVLPYFKRSEDHYAGASEFHGAGGEWRVERQRLRWDILEVFRDAAAEVGIPRCADFNTGDNAGSSYFDVNQRRGRRVSAADAFLKPVLKRPNLRLMTDAMATRLLLQGQRVVGVEIRHRQQRCVARIGQGGEVLLTAGAVNSPQLLELSGIGDPQRLAAVGIECQSPLPGVGENLQDHLQIRTVFRLKDAYTLNQQANSWFGKATMGLDYLLFRRGPLSMAPSQLGLFARSCSDLDRPDLEFHIQPLSTDKLGEPLHDFPAITASVCQLRPASRGRIHLQSPDPTTQPIIDTCYLSEREDRQSAARAIRLTRRILAAKAVSRYQPQELLPGEEHQSDGELAARAGDIATTIFHPVGTCKMGHDAMAVVDDRLRVHGVSGLRVVDASIMPTLVSGNTNSPVIMIAEKAAEMIVEDRTLIGKKNQ